MANVKLREGEHFESAIKRFRREVDRENIIRELKERQYYQKPARVRKVEGTKLKKRMRRSASKMRAILRNSH